MVKTQIREEIERMERGFGLWVLVEEAKIRLVKIIRRNGLEIKSTMGPNQESISDG